MPITPDRESEIETELEKLEAYIDAQIEHQRQWELKQKSGQKLVRRPWAGALILPDGKQ